MKTVDNILARAEQGERLTEDDALLLYLESDLIQLADSANKVRHRIHPEPVVTFVVDRNINYTNVCTSECLFCAFFKGKDESESYIITKGELDKKIQETIDLGGTQILLQGGMHPELGIDYYVDLLKHIKGNFKIHVHGFSPPEIHYLSEKSGISVDEVLEKLVGAGLGSIPGGGAEILVDEVRGKVSPNKCKSSEWLGVMSSAHKLGLKTTATMMFGHYEKPEHIIEHLMKIRTLQDETGGFTAFIPWTFQPGNTKIDVKTLSSAEYLRVLALSRLVLDNVPNIQASWVTQGDKIAQTALMFGANDLGSTMIEENVVAAAGVSFMLSKEEMIRLISSCGMKAKQRDCFYNIIREYEAA